ncbi:MAG: aminotransferase class I/II-fold pyridoxal phosphate-dependent enzyme [Oscillospiraceae bacterium]|nr:aminotransferase class I/II-fold pyridoxal phosphate-dependent enzyme [Oscillospiraceae bacterium]
MKKYTEMTAEELREELREVTERYEVLKEMGLSLNMARGKPGKAQLDMVSGILDVLRSDSDFVCDGIDVRNYGNLEGLPSCRELFAELLGVEAKNVFIGGTASLTLMYDTIAKAYTHGRVNSSKPWAKLDKVKWLCPAPGYDGHFGISQSFGMEMITVPMTAEGPDMDVVEKLIRDPEVKGMWCVPKYSNPDGIIYSAETIRRIASMKPAAEDFLLMWDNAYCVHEFFGEYVPFPDILSECAKYGNEDMVFEFASTSKITFPGAGVSVFVCSDSNMTYMKKLLNAQMISFDKVNQLRHVRFLKDKAGVLELMKKHAEILGPKFRCVLDSLDREIAPRGIASWQHPNGGYFVSVNTMPGIAKATWQLCKEAGLTMTDAGATFPYKNDPNDSNMRIAPSLPPTEQLEQAMEIYCVSMRLAALRKLCGIG